MGLGFYLSLVGVIVFARMSKVHGEASGDYHDAVVRYPTIMAVYKRLLKEFFVFHGNHFLIGTHTI